MNSFTLVTKVPRITKKTLNWSFSYFLSQHKWFTINIQMLNKICCTVNVFGFVLKKTEVHLKLTRDKESNDTVCYLKKKTYINVYINN